VPSGHDTDNSPNWISQTRSRLAVRRSERPATKAGQIRALWPDIEAALAAGQTTKTICTWLAVDGGITLSVTSLTSYISRIRRRERGNRHFESPLMQSVQSEFGSLPTWREPGHRLTPETRVTQPPGDPLAQAMRVLSRPVEDNHQSSAFGQAISVNYFGVPNRGVSSYFQ
jgi:hypothetical protein